MKIILKIDISNSCYNQLRYFYWKTACATVVSVDYTYHCGINSTAESLLADTLLLSHAMLSSHPDLLCTAGVNVPWWLASVGFSFHTLCWARQNWPMAPKAALLTSSCGNWWMPIHKRAQTSVTHQHYTQSLRKPHTEAVTHIVELINLLEAGLQERLECHSEREK